MTSIQSFSLKRRLGLTVSVVGMAIVSGLMSEGAYAQNEGCDSEGTLITCGIGNNGIDYFGTDLKIVAAPGGMSSIVASGNAVSLEGYGDLVFDNSINGDVAADSGVISSAGGTGVAISASSWDLDFGHEPLPPSSVDATIFGRVFGEEHGVGAVSYSPTGSLAITTTESSELTGNLGSGIYALHYGSGLSVVTGDRSTVDSNWADGIDVRSYGTGVLSISTGEGSAVSGRDYGLHLSSEASISITNAGIIQGSYGAIYANSSAPVDIVNNGILRNSSGLAGGLTVRVLCFEGCYAAASDTLGGTLTNNGSLVGRLETFSQSFTVNNAAGGTWETSGNSDFAGAADSIINEGVLKVMSDPASFTGLEFFGGTGTIDMVDGSTGDTLTIVTSSYRPGGTVRLDVFLNGADSTNDKLVINDLPSTEPGLLAASDIPVASETSGVTTIQLNYLTGGSDVAPVNGLVLVESAQTLTAGSFVLEEDPVRPDLFFTDILSSRLSDSGRTELVLERQFKPEAPVLPPPLPPSSVIVVDAEPKLDAAMGVPGVETPGVEPGPYVQSVGSAFSANTEGTMRNGAESFNVDLPFDMNVVGVIAGLDRMQKGTSASGVPYAWLVGGFGGYVTSSATFEDLAGSQQSDGGVVGAYAAAAYAQWRVHLAAKADFGVTDMSTGRDSDSATYWAPGVSFNAGYRHQLTPTSYFQPIATLSYVHRSLGDVSLEGTDINYDDTESLRGRIGFRVGSFGQGESHTIEPWMQASVWHEFLGESQATFTGASGALDFTGLGAGTFAEIGGGVNVLSRTVPGFSGNIRTELSFGDRSMMGLSGKLGLEYRFPVN